MSCFSIRIEVLVAGSTGRSVIKDVAELFARIMRNGDELDEFTHLGVLLVEDDSDLVEVKLCEPRGEPLRVRVVITQNEAVRDRWIVGRTGLAENAFELRLEREIDQVMAWHHGMSWSGGQVRFAHNFQRSRAGDPARQETTRLWEPECGVPTLGALVLPKRYRERTRLADTSHLRV